MSDELSLPVLLLIANRASERRIHDALRAAGFDGWTTAQARVAAGLDEEGTRISVLADRANIAKQTATALVDKLERNGYVARVPDPTDGRATLVRATDRGRAARPVARAEEARIEEDWTAVLGARRMRQLREALTLLRAAVDPYAE
jgi:DNA-binding MarR family transcriptional regulator